MDISTMTALHAMNNITITFPDGAQKSYESGISAEAIAKAISPSLAKKAVLARFNTELLDMTRPLNQSGALEFLMVDHADVLETLRHDTAHVFAEAVKEIWPEVQITIGPAIENGFYYDIYREESFTPEDLPVIEKKMRDIVQRNEALTRHEWTREEAIKYFKSIGEHFKVELIEAIPAGEIISLYQQGAFIDLCRGPHFPSTGKIGTAFKLTKIAGAYWRGDSNNPVMQRIYGTVWPTQEALDAYLHQVEEAEKRDHRKLGGAMELFHFQEEGPGVVFWHPKGWVIYRELQDYIRYKLRDEGYREVNTPQLLDKSLWEKSGHWAMFQENMFVAEVEKRTMALKPMSCPGAIQIFKQGQKSYRDLPLRLSEFGNCHRNEPSGALHGLLRVRGMTQDDAHIFCTPQQITDETIRFCKLLAQVYDDMGFGQPVVKFSDRPEKRAGTEEVWDLAEAALEEATRVTGLKTIRNPGEGAFYGPKLEFVLKDAIGRDWQLGTLQVDFILPERLGASYVGEDGQKHVPVVLHRAILGSLERFMGVLIEHYAGKFPLWLAPTQAVVTPITNDLDKEAAQVCDQLKAKGLRAELDIRNEKINYKVRDLSHAKVPYIFVVGKKEIENGTVSIRTLGSQEQTVMPLEEAIEKLYTEALPPYRR